MKHLFFTIVFGFISALALGQFGIAERQFIQETKEGQTISIIAKGDIEEIKVICAEMNLNLKYAYQDLAAIEIPKEKLENFYASLDKVKLEIPLGKATTLMDTALIHNNVVAVHNGLSPLLQSYKGSGVIIGILDSGIYFDHDDFRNADGTTRIKYIWDQNDGIPSNPPAPYNYGQEWTWVDINNGACNHVEPANQFGHGTTVAGAACGNGLATGTNTGVAPESEIIAVAVDYYGSDFLSNTVDAIDYVFKKADALGKPCVINTSFGTYYGSHDGRDFASQLIDALIEERPGRAVVASAGNGNNLQNTDPNFVPTHLSYPLSSDTNFTWFVTQPSGTVYFDIWADTEDFDNAFFNIGSNDNTTFDKKAQLDFFSVNSFQGNLQAGVYVTQFVFAQNGANEGKVEMYLEETEGRYHLEVLITPADLTDLWRLEMTGQGTFDIWSSRTFQGTSNMVFNNLPPNFVYPPIDFYKAPDNEKCIVSSWQCSDKVITVGNFANKSAYYDVDSTFWPLGLTPGEIYYKSSEGPTRDNRLKPEISATGNLIFATGNLDFIASALAINRKKVAPGAMHNYNGGTSMSSPVVAGAVALYLEQNPNAWWYEIKEALAQTAKKDAFTGTTANNVYGNGKLDAFELLQFEAVLGCTDDTMFNYNPLANVNDGSCIPVMMGCTDSTALNFNPNANTDDGTCIPLVMGCTDTLANNYNPNANVDDGSCTYDPDTTSIRDILNANLFELHPNPSKTYVVIEFSGYDAKENYQIQIVDLLGREHHVIGLRSVVQKIDLNSLSAGMYIVNLLSNQEVVSSKKLRKE